MKFFFPDSLDLVDPSFDFETETRSPSRVRQRDEMYAHEVFARPPYDGLLVSKAIVDGTAASNGRYTLPQRHRLLREGVRRFFRLDERLELQHIETIGDCGAFSYVNEDRPSYSVDDVLQFYETCGFSYGLSVDHVILGYDATVDNPRSLGKSNRLWIPGRRRSASINSVLRPCELCAIERCVAVVLFPSRGVAEVISSDRGR